ncbi:MAG: hypothetical protein SO314_03910 [Alphaproteobacteria bacterium]|nr:hypothetical protein [Alphaproteobacteria bacterium]
MKKYVPIILLTVTGCAVLGDILFTPQDILNNYKKEYMCDTFSSTYSEYKGQAPVLVYKKYLSGLCKKNSGFLQYATEKVASSKFSDEMKENVKKLLSNNGEKQFAEKEQNFFKLKIEKSYPEIVRLRTLYYLDTPKCRSYVEYYGCEIPNDIKVGYYDTQREYIEKEIISLYNTCDSQRKEIQAFAKELLVHYMNKGKKERFITHQKVLSKAKVLKKYLAGRTLDTNAYDVFKYKQGFKKNVVYTLGSGDYSDLKLTIAQNIQGGWLVDYVVYDTQILPYSLESIKSLNAMGKIFIHNVPNKEATGDYLPSGFYVYKGVYSYQTIMGSTNTVHAFEYLKIPDEYYRTDVWEAMKVL